jgi:CRISPR/Cas system Type II protein with McrA/HNH and RuvC-like nuclease domain
MIEVGLDLGTNSVGWAIVAPTDGRAHVVAGSYVFPEAGEEEGGEFVSNRRKRGEKRRQRKQLRRKRQRRRSVAHHLADAGFLPPSKDEQFAVLTNLCPYKARAEALDRRLEPYELGRAIYHLAKRRGYLSTAALKLIGIPNVGELDARLARKAIERTEKENADGEQAKEALKEAKGVLDNIERTRSRLDAGEARTLGELLYQEVRRNRPVRAITGARISRPLESSVSSALGKSVWDGMKAEARKKILDGLRKLAPLLQSPQEEEKVAKHLETLSEYGLSHEVAVRLASTAVRNEVLGIRGDRRMYEEEFDAIVAAQRPYYPDILTDEYVARLRNAVFYQRPLKPTSGLVGNCSILSDKKRCPMATMLAQHSVILQRLTSLNICHRDGSQRRLRPEEIHILVDALDRPPMLDIGGKKLSWDKASQLIKLGDDEFFADNPPSEDGKKRRRKKGASGLDGLPGNRTSIVMYDAIGDKWLRLPNSGNNGKSKEGLLHRILTCQKMKDIAPGLKRDFSLTDDEIYYLATAKLPDGYNKHCARVLRRIEPFLRKGLVYSEALEAANIREPNVSTEKTPESPSDYAASLKNIANPVVQRAVKNALIVLNAIIAKHGRPSVVRIELPRDVARTNKQRQQVQEAQKRREQYNEAARKALREAGLPGEDSRSVLKVRLWQEAGCRSPYMPEQELTIHQVVNECDIDHIIPRSRSLDDSYLNLTIAPNQINLAKGDKTPYEAFGHDEERWARIKAYLNTVKSMPQSKKQRILAEKLEETGFVGRDFSDTSYIAREVMNAVKATGIPVEVTRGALTAELRKLWGLNEVLPLTDQERDRLLSASKRGAFKNRDDHRHHALDAIVTALMNRSTFQRLTKYYKTKENYRNVPRSQAPKFELEKPWSSFVEDVARVIEAAPVVFQPTRKVAGALHEETGRTPPSRDEVERAIASLPEHRRKKVRRAVVVGSQLVYLDKDGEPLTAYDLGSNHHCIIWECTKPDAKGRTRRELEVVTMIEAATRATCGEPVFSAQHSNRGPEWKPFLFLCKNDIVEYDDPEHGRRLMRVAQFSQWTVVRRGKRRTSESTASEIVLRPVKDARQIKENNVRVKGQDALARILRRVILSPLGDEIGSEPQYADDQPGS